VQNQGNKKVTNAQEDFTSGGATVFKNRGETMRQYNLWQKTEISGT